MYYRRFVNDICEIDSMLVALFRYTFVVSIFNHFEFISLLVELVEIATLATSVSVRCIMHLPDEFCTRCSVAPSSKSILIYVSACVRMCVGACAWCVYVCVREYVIFFCLSAFQLT